ncbi:MAG: N-acetyl-gamma-glutamyl-phosphate reductase [Andreesenia angusta]|nr:N-acetyl-gamma-glutamyl-phosphate reductase [Andreesenia angusta]
MVKVGVIGATGYVGTELIRLLMKHKNVQIEAISSRTYDGQNYDDIYENYRDVFKLKCKDMDIAEMAEKVDLIFLALPHGIASKQLDKKILEKVKIIDMGADYRLSDVDNYEKWYATDHGSKDILKEAVYGLPELYREDIKKARIVANPGCYPTSSILSIYPLIREGIIDENSLIIDAKSGITGAGRSVNLATHFTESNESFKAYGIASHRHTPEIEEQLSKFSDKEIVLNFTPHLVPMNRGILTTSYAKMKVEKTYKEIKDIYDKYYGDEFFVRMTKENIFPETKWVKGSNFCDIGIKIDQRTNRIIVIGAIDNMIKGSAGQALQNMNIIFGFDEKEGIDDISIFPI